MDIYRVPIMILVLQFLELKLCFPNSAIYITYFLPSICQIYFFFINWIFFILSITQINNIYEIIELVSIYNFLIPININV